jgi:hypothetical protein
MRWLVLVICLLLSFPVSPAPMAVAMGDKATVLLTDEPCKLKSVTNLPMRATWTENSVTTEGCWGNQGPIIVAFWEADKTVSLMHISQFKKATEI